MRNKTIVVAAGDYEHRDAGEAFSGQVLVQLGSEIEAGSVDLIVATQRSRGGPRIITVLSPHEALQLASALIKQASIYLEE